MRRIQSTTLFSLLLLCSLNFSSCKKEDQQQTPAQIPTPTYFLKGFLGDVEIITPGVPSYFTDAMNQNNENGNQDSSTIGDHNADGHHDNGNVNGGQRSLSITGCKWNISDSQGILTTTGSVELRKEVFRIYVTPFTSSEYYTLVEPGLYNFANDDSPDGAYVTMRDADGVLWTSDGEQSGSSFVITTRQNLDSLATITGTFSCKMYNSNGTMKPFTSGTFTANVGL